MQLSKVLLFSALASFTLAVPLAGDPVIVEPAPRPDDPGAPAPAPAPKPGDPASSPSDPDTDPNLSAPAPGGPDKACVVNLLGTISAMC